MEKDKVKKVKPGSKKRRKASGGVGANPRFSLFSRKIDWRKA